MDGFDKKVFAKGDGKGGGQVYEGGWKEGKFYGFGKYLFPCGTVYEGEYENDKFKGHGKYMFAYLLVEHHLERVVVVLRARICGAMPLYSWMCLRSRCCSAACL